MTYKELAQKDLERYMTCALDVLELQNRMDSLRCRIEQSVKPPKTISIQENPDPESKIHLLHELCDLGMEYRKKIRESEYVCAVIEQRIMDVGGIHSAILYRRYCQLKEWSIICCELRSIKISGEYPFQYDDRSIYRQHDKALEVYGKMLSVNVS